MPILTVILSTPPDAARSTRVAGLLSSLTAHHLGKDPALTSVAISHVDPAHWIVGGRSLADQGLNSAWVEIKVTAGTNTKDEKAAWLKAVHEALAAELSPLHPETYAHVHEVLDDAYGFSGRSQGERYHTRRLGL